MADVKERLVRCLKYCASTTETGNDCGGCERWGYDCGSAHCVDDLLKQAAEALERQMWISVRERLPQEDLDPGEVYKMVQVLLKDGTVTVGFCNRWMGRWFYMPIGEMHFMQNSYDTTPVVAWMPLSEPPKEE